MTSPTTRVLLVEDNPGDADLIREALSEEQVGSFETDTVDRLSSALSRLSSRTDIDVVLLDLTLPDSSGLDALIGIKRRTPDMPVVVLTGLDDEALAVSALRQGAQDYLVKGRCEGELIRRALRYAIERRQSQTVRLHLAEEQAARAAAEQALERSALVARASILLNSSFEYERTLPELAHLVVPRWADICVIELRNDDGIEHLSVAHVQPEKAALAEQIWRRHAPSERSERASEASRGGGGTEPPVRWPAAPSASSPLAEVARTRQSLLLSEIPDSILVENARESEDLSQLRSLETKSAVLAPMVIRGQLFGIVAFASTQPAHRFARADLAMAEDLARRVELAVDNARLYAEAQRAIKEAQASLHARDEFMAIAAHELRTPLTPLMLRLATLRKLLRDAAGEGGDNRLIEKLNQAMKAADRLGKLVENLLDVSRITSGRLQLNREETDLCELVREVAGRFHEEASRAGSKLTLRAEGRLIGTWDKLRVEQILTNLLSNAIKYGAGKPVEIAVAADRNAARVVVRDHGIGISEEERAHIFGRFARAVSSRQYGGLGLGLYITQQIVEAHGGSIDVSSELGAGAAFTVKLPRHAVTEQHAVV